MPDVRLLDEVSFDEADIALRPSVKLPSSVDLVSESNETKSGTPPRSKGDKLGKPIVFKYTDIIRTITGNYSLEYELVKHIPDSDSFIVEHKVSH